MCAMCLDWAQCIAGVCKTCFGCLWMPVVFYVCNWFEIWIYIPNLHVYCLSFVCLMDAVCGCGLTVSVCLSVQCFL